MKTKVCAILLASLLVSVSAFPQGSLTPPGAPTPTMKSLDQVEPRVDIATLPGDGTTVRIISNPGSYYLTGNLAGAAGKETIRVAAAASRVTIDLNGFSLTNTGTDRVAIAVSSPADGVVIRNGTIVASVGTSTRAVSGGDRVACEDLAIVGTGGIDALVLGTDSAVRRCRLVEGGIKAGDRSSVSDTVVFSTNNASVALEDDASIIGLKFTTNRAELRVGDRGLLADCQVNAAGPPTIFGLTGNLVQTGSSSVVRRCTVSAGTVAGNAIGVGTGSLVEGCRVLSAFREGILSNLGDNVTVVDSSVQGNGRVGISLGGNARVRDCVVLGSGTTGISVEENSAISGCTVSAAGASGIASSSDNVAVSRCVVTGSGSGSGISLVSGSVTDCDVSATTGGPGIQVTQACRVERNRSTNNGTAPSPQSGIKVIGANSRIEGNHIANNAGIGLEVTASGGTNVNTGNLVIGNNSRNNAGGNYSISAGNAAGPIVPIASMSTNTNPGANYGP